jgi:hypothetical protein
VGCIVGREGTGGQVQRLLKEEADVNTQGGGDRSAPYETSALRHDMIIQPLPKEGADVNTQGGFSGSAPQAASAGGHDQIIQRLKHST